MYLTKRNIGNIMKISFSRSGCKDDRVFEQIRFLKTNKKQNKFGAHIKIIRVLLVGHAIRCFHQFFTDLF